MQKPDALSGPFISNFNAKEVVEMDFKNHNQDSWWSKDYQMSDSNLSPKFSF